MSVIAYKNVKKSYESSTVTLISSANENNILHDQSRTLVNIGNLSELTGGYILGSELSSN